MLPAHLPLVAGHTHVMSQRQAKRPRSQARMSTRSQGSVVALVTPRSASLHFSGDGIGAHHRWHSCLVRFSGGGIVPRHYVQASKSPGSSMRITSLAMVLPLRKHVGMSKIGRPVGLESCDALVCALSRFGRGPHNKLVNTDALRRPAASPLPAASRRLHAR